MSQNGTCYVNYLIIRVKSRLVLLQCRVCCECNLIHSYASREWLCHGNSAEDRCRRDLIWPAFSILNTTLVLYFYVQNHLQLQAVGQFWREPLCSQRLSKIHLFREFYVLRFYIPRKVYYQSLFRLLALEVKGFGCVKLDGPLCHSQFL